MAYYGKRAWLEDIRVAKGYSQDKTAAIAGISQALYSKVEMGYKNPSDKLRKVIAEALEFEPDRFDLEDDAMRRAAV